MIVPVLLWAAEGALIRFDVLPAGTINPFAYLLFLSGRQPDGTYLKQWADAAFVAYSIIFWTL
jgi:hypothetical protein